MRKIGILGGAFDPPTTGHLSVAKYVAKHVPEIDAIWITPCNSHVFGKKMVYPYQRLEMCYLVLQDENINKFGIFTYEIIKNLPGDTYTFIKTLKEDSTWNKVEFSLIIGQDNADHIENWVKNKELREMIRFIVVLRFGEASLGNDSWYTKVPHIFVNPKENPYPTESQISSTLVRDLLRERYKVSKESELDLKRIDSLLEKVVNPKVLDYILKNELYND